MTRLPQSPTPLCVICDQPLDDSQPLDQTEMAHEACAVREMEENRRADAEWEAARDAAPDDDFDEIPF